MASLTNISECSEKTRLENVQKLLEKENNILLERFQHLTDLKLTRNNLTEERKRINRSLYEEVTRMFKTLFHVKHKLTQIDNVDLQDLKTEMIAVQNKLQSFKSELMERGKALQAEQIAFEEDLKVIDERKLLEWSQPEPTAFRNMSAKFKNYNHYLVGDAENFITFLKDNEIIPWSLEEHCTFLKVRKKYKERGKMLKVLKGLLSEKPQSDILAYEDCYLKYLEYKKLKLDGIKSQRSENLETCKSLEEISPKPKIKRESTKDVKEKLLTWKKEKELNELKETQIKALAIKKAKEFEERKRAKNEETKKQIQEWKICKSEGLELIEMEKRKLAEVEREYRAWQANRLIKSFQKQDLNFVQKMRSLHVRQNTEKGSRKKKILVIRDPERLLKPTRQWICRTLPRKDLQEAPICNIQHVNKLGIPSWRKNV